jgi:hypothetical protein
MLGYLIVLVLAVALGTTLLTTPLVRVLARRIGAVVRPDERRVHERPTPTLGGVAMYLGFLAAMAPLKSPSSPGSSPVPRVPGRHGHRHSDPPVRRGFRQHLRASRRGAGRHYQLYVVTHPA